MVKAKTDRTKAQRQKEQQAKAQHGRDWREIKEARRATLTAKRAVKDAKRKEAVARLRAKVVERAALRRQYKPQPVSWELASSTGHVEEISFENFSEVAKAAVIKVTRTEHGFELLLSNGFKASVEPGPAGLHVQAAEARPADAVSARLWLSRDDENEFPSAALIQERLWHVRQLYALIFLLLTGDLELAKDALLNDSAADLESFVPKECRLLVPGLGAGTAWIDVVVRAGKAAYEKAMKAPDAALNAISLVWEKGRDRFWRRVEASTRLREQAAAKAAEDTRTAAAKARQAEAKAARDEQLAVQESIKTAKSFAKAMREIDGELQKIKDPELKEKSRSRLHKHISGLQGKDDGILPPPS